MPFSLARCGPSPDDRKLPAADPVLEIRRVVAGATDHFAGGLLAGCPLGYSCIVGPGSHLRPLPICRQIPKERRGRVRRVATSH